MLNNVWSVANEKDDIGSECPFRGYVEKSLISGVGN
jgi:hypothetical protein